MKPKSKLNQIAAPAVAAMAAFWSAPAFADGAPDLDGDGIPNIVDPDIDNDGIPNALDPNVDGGIAIAGPFRGQHIGDHIDNDNPAEEDIDADGLADDSLGEKDIDGDGKADDDPAEADIDGDMRNDDDPAERDIDGDGRRDDDDNEDDIDGDGLDDDDDDAEADIDGDGVSDDDDDDIDGDNRGNGDNAESDTDGDGLDDDDDAERNDDGDSRDDRADDDDDNDGNTDEDDPDHHHEDDEVEVQISLNRVAAPADGRCRVKIQRMAFGEVEFEVDGRDRSGQMPAGDYEIVIDGVVRGLFPLLADDDELEGEVEFETFPDDEDEQLLDFDVIGLPIQIRRDGVVYYEGTVPTPPPFSGGAAPGETGTGIVSLSPGDAAPPAALGVAEVEFDVLGADELEVEVQNLPAGDYSLIVGADTRGVIGVVAGRGRIRFDRFPDDDDEWPLDFAIAGQPISVERDGEVVFFGQLPQSPGMSGDDPAGGGDNDGAPGGEQTLALIPSPNLPPLAHADIQAQFGIAGLVGLEIEAENLPAGVYDVAIDGIVRASIAVVTDGQGTRGKVRFETTPKASDDLLLDFLAAGLTVKILKGDTVLFSGTVPQLL